MNSPLRSVVLVGFAPFGRYAANSSEQAIKAIVKRRVSHVWIKDWEIFPATIPHYDRGSAVLDLAHRSNATSVVCLGMASDRVGFSVETRARNLIRNTTYCPEQSGQPVDASVDLGAESDIDLRQWNIGAFGENCANAGLPQPSLSTDAGGFCCNHLMFQLFSAARRRPEFGTIPWVFLHVPCSEEAVRPQDVASFEAAGKVRMKLDDVVKCLEIFLQTATPVRTREAVPA